jgi:hypothetical protein
MPSLDSFKEKAGPLPVYGWVIVISVLGFGYYYYAKKKSATTSSAADQAGTATSTDTGPSSDQYAAGEIQAEYSLANQLALTQSGVSVLATNVGRNTTATTQNTMAEKKEAVGTVHKPPVKRKPPIVHKKKPPVKRRPHDDKDKDTGKDDE